MRLQSYAHTHAHTIEYGGTATSSRDDNLFSTTQIRRFGKILRKKGTKTYLPKMMKNMKNI